MEFLCFYGVGTLSGITYRACSPNPTDTSGGYPFKFLIYKLCPLLEGGMERSSVFPYVGLISDNMEKAGEKVIAGQQFPL